MSFRHKCPYCNNKISISIELKKSDWKDSGRRGNKNQKRKFNHERAIEFFQSGISVSAIAQHMGVSYQAIYEVLKRNGLK